MSDPVATQTSILYLAQFVLGLGIALVLRHFSKMYPRIHLLTWSMSAFFFCIHALSYAVLSSYTRNFPLRLTASLSSSIFNNLHIVLMVIGTYQAIKVRQIKSSWYLTFVLMAIGTGLISTMMFAFDPQEFLKRYAFRIGWLEFITSISFITMGLILFITQNLKGIGVKVVSACFFLYGLTHAYNFSVVIRGLLGIKISLPLSFGLVELVLIALIGFGLVIWLLEDEREELRKTNKELDSFIYSTSHDLRAPLASVLGLINVARLELKETKSMEFFALIEGRIQKLDAVIGDILRLSRVKKSELKYELINFGALLADSMADVKFMDGSKKIELRYQDAPSNLFLGDYNLTKMVLGNLLSNAIKYHCPDKANPFIEVEFRKTPRQVSFVVTDNGEGIAEEHQRKVFEMFYRASTNSNGTGLGLYIVKETLVKIGGSVAMESKEGHGTTFKVTLEQPA